MRIATILSFLLWQRTWFLVQNQRVWFNLYASLSLSLFLRFYQEQNLFYQEQNLRERQREREGMREREREEEVWACE